MRSPGTGLETAEAAGGAILIQTGTVPPEPKTCASCGRRIEWRKKWERDWENVRYCSASCRRRGVTRVDQELEDGPTALLAAAGRRGTVDPADAIGRVAADVREDLSEPARRAARRLVADGVAEVVQGGRVVDASTAKGPFRLRAASPR